MNMKHLILCALVILMGIPAASAMEPTTEPFNPELALMLYRGKDALLITAAAQKKEKEALLLLELPGVNVHFKDGSGRTALHYAAMNGLAKLARKLLQRGADKNAADTNGSTPLQLAEEHKQSAILGLFLNKF